MSDAGQRADPPAGGAAAAATRLINIVRTDRPVSFHITQLPTQLQPGVELCVSDNPLVDDHIDLYILPADRLTGLSAELEHHSCPVLAYGPPELLPLAFDWGCADYLREPWEVPELKVRVLRLLPPRRLCFGWGVVELHRSTLTVIDRPIPAPHPVPSEVELSPPEATLFRQLSAASGSPVSRECLQCTLARLHAPQALQSPPVQFSPGTAGIPQQSGRAVDVHMSALRKKLNRLAGYKLAPPPIRSIYGYGYQLIPK